MGSLAACLRHSLLRYNGGHNKENSRKPLQSLRTHKENGRTRKVGWPRSRTGECAKVCRERPKPADVSRKKSSV